MFLGSAKEILTNFQKKDKNKSVAADEQQRTEARIATKN
jgi:hypothetical protein